MSMRYPGGLIATSPVNARYPSGVWTQAQAAPYQAQNVWTRDQFWPYTTLLLQGDGATNGAQNNTFLDSSSNNFTITRNGNTTQGAFTPYEQNGYWSNYFDGSSILTFASSTNYVPGSGQFCLECWFFPTTTSGDRWLIGNRNGNYVPFGINYPATTYPGTLLFYISSNGSSWDVVNGTTVSGVNANQWNHFALVRNSSNQFIVYINGVGTTIATNAANFTSAQPFYVGGSPSAGDADFIGYISNTRFVKGDSVYSGNFTPSTAPLTAITNTQLLTSQSNRFIDNSTNAVTPTLTGTPSVQAFQPFPGATTWSASVLGGSGYFDGSGDYLSGIGTTSSFNFMHNSTALFTFECWVYWQGTTSPQVLFATNNTGSANIGVSIVIDTGDVVNLYITRGVSGAANVVCNANSVSTVPKNTWLHIAITYDQSLGSNNAKIYFNGVLNSQTTKLANAPSSSDATYSAAVGGSNTGLYPLTGYLSNLRISNSIVYSSAFTPPTTPVTGGTLLMNFSNAGIYDNSMMNNLETVGNAQVSTSVVKYGTGSMAFDGSGDYLTLANVLNTNLGSGPFTIELWAYFNSASGTQFILSNYQDSTNGYGLGLSSGVISFWATGDTPDISSGLTPTTGVWYHIAVSGQSGAIRLFINGTQYGSTFTGTPALNSTATLRIGDGQGAASPQAFNGYIDDLRITKGAARYITTFTPPPARLPAQ